MNNENNDAVKSLMGLAMFTSSPDYVIRVPGDVAVALVEEAKSTARLTGKNAFFLSDMLKCENISEGFDITAGVALEAVWEMTELRASYRGEIDFEDC